MGQVALRGIRKRHEAVDVIQGIDLAVRDGGPSGRRKSAMLRMIAGLESITGGDLMIDGVRASDLRPADCGAAMVFQRYALYPHMTVAENMGFSLKMSGVARAERQRAAIGRAQARTASRTSASDRRGRGRTGNGGAGRAPGRRVDPAFAHRRCGRSAAREGWLRQQPLRDRTAGVGEAEMRWTLAFGSDGVLI